MPLISLLLNPRVLEYVYNLLYYVYWITEGIFAYENYVAGDCIEDIRCKDIISFENEFWCCKGCKIDFS